ncbi:MAG: winged helix-turn-helix transcriptional regulator [Candidatus Thorarchaeota archaeon]
MQSRAFLIGKYNLNRVPVEFTSAREYVTQIINRKGRHVNLYDYLTAYPHEFLRGILVAGSIGSGKSQRAMRIVRAAVDADFGCIVFNPSTDYQRLYKVNPDTVVIDMIEFYQNPIEPPPGMPMSEWAPVFIQVFAQTFGLKDPSIAITQKQLNTLTASYQDGVDEPPILRELHAEVEKYIPRSRSQETSSHASVLNRLELILESQMERCLNVRHGFQPTDFEEGLLVVKLRPLGNERVHEFMIGIAIAKLYAYRSYRLRTGQPMGKSIFIVIEEAHRFLSEKRQGDRYGQRMYVERALVECRKYGLGFMVVDQLPHQVSSHVTSSCNMWVVGRLIDADARRQVGVVLCLDDVWSRDGLMELPTGAAFIRVERMKELEDTSPLVKPPLSILYTDITYLPAIVASPVSQTDLLEPLSDTRIESLMATNIRYLRFFERNVRQDIDRIRKSVSQHTRIALDAFLERILGEDKHHDQDFLLYYGLQESSMHRQHYDTGVITPLTRQQIDELVRHLTILSSRPCKKVIMQLHQSNQLTLSQISSETNMSVSWTSRTLKRIQDERLIVRANAMYELTKRGRSVLKWAKMLKGLGNESINGSRLSISLEDAHWLLKSIERGRELRENSVIAGWYGRDKNREDLLRLEMLSRYIIEKYEPKTKNDDGELDDELLSTLNVGMTSGILPALLSVENLFLQSELAEEVGLSSSGIRRHVANLEKEGIIKRQWKSGRRYVVLDSSFQQHLSKSFREECTEINLDGTMIKKMCKVAVDTELLRLLIRGDGQWDSFETLLGRCFKILRK